MALRGIRVIELAGLAPVPFCGMILADHGATVIRVDKIGENYLDCLGNGKLSLSVDMKHPKGVKIMKELIHTADVLIEPFRPGVMEKLGLGPVPVMKENEKLIYARLHGYGKNSEYVAKAGHDINYLSVSGLLSMFRWRGGKPQPPINLAADFGGGGLMTVFGIMLALYERQLSGKGQLVECDMTSGAAYLASWLYRSQKLPIWGSSPGKNLLDGGSPSYDTYETKDGKWMAVGSLEPQFYARLLEGLGLCEDEAPQYSEESHSVIEKAFKTKDQSIWIDIFRKLDACVTPVLEASEVSDIPTVNGVKCPKAMPLLGRTPGESKGASSQPRAGQDTIQILQEIGYSKNDILRLENENVIKFMESNKL